MSLESHKQEYKYVAFISYSHKDEKIAKWLQKNLEAYKLPTEIQNEIRNSRYLRPIFRDTSDLNTGILSEELNCHLKLSKYLIVICSPHSATSTWVNKEVQTFIEMGRLSSIIPIVIDGEIDSSNGQECLPTYLKKYTSSFPEKELLCIDLRECGREKALIRVISYILDIEFDTLWHRHQRETLIRWITAIFTSAIFITALFWVGIPISLGISIHDEKCHLPAMRRASLKIGGIEYSELKPDTIIIHKFPGYMRLTKIPLSFNATYYQPVDTTIRLNTHIAQSMTLMLHRDDTFKTYAGQIVDENYEPIGGVMVAMEGGHRCISDENGKFRIEIPLEEQTVCKRIHLNKDGYADIIREDESASTSITYILRKIK